MNVGFVCVCLLLLELLDSLDLLVDQELFILKLHNDLPVDHPVILLARVYLVLGVRRTLVQEEPARRWAQSAVD